MSTHRVDRTVLRGPAYLVTALFVLSGCATAAAQGRPDINADAYYATLTLDSGFSDDPRSFNITAGGSASTDGLGSGCQGSVATRPDIRLTYDAGTIFPLNIYATSDSDITLIVNRPDGSWICNDDYDGLNPAVLMDRPQSGRYEIWVGTYGGGNAPAVLYVSELDPDFDRNESTSLDLNGTPIYSTLTLNSGFSDDPRTVNLRAGGEVEVSGLGAGCTGYASRPPDVRLTYDAGTIFPLNIYAASDDGDLTLLVNRPDETWLCSDDYDGRNPAVLMSNPQSGRYDIWVGVYSGGQVDATLYISELDPDF